MKFKKASALFAYIVCLVAAFETPDISFATPVTFNFIGQVSDSENGGSMFIDITPGATISGSLTVDPTVWTVVTNVGGTTTYMDLTASLIYTASYGGSKRAYYYPAATNYTFPYPGIEIQVTTNATSSTISFVYCAFEPDGYSSSFSLAYSNAFFVFPTETIGKLETPPVSGNLIVGGNPGRNVGTLSYFGVPASLKSTKSGTNLVFSWTYWTSSYQLQSGSGAGTNMVWTDVTNTPIETNDGQGNAIYQLTLPFSTTGNQLFRLRGVTLPN